VITLVDLQDAQISSKSRKRHKKMPIQLEDEVLDSDESNTAMQIITEKGYLHINS